MKTALVLAGGSGTRLRPITDEIPKPLLPVSGKPTVEWILDLLDSAGIEKAILAIGYKADMIEKRLGEKYKNVEIIYSVEKEPLGTGGAIKFAEKHLDGTFVVFNGDNLVEIDLEKMLELHRSQGTLATISLIEVEDPSPFGVALLDGNKIMKFIEKPKKEEAPSRLINAGVLILEPEILDYIPESGFCSLEKEVFQKIAPKGEVSGFVFSGKWFPTDTMEKYAIANAFWR